MKNATDILKHIEGLEKEMIRRPTMWAQNPESLEDQLVLLENLRAFILEENAEYRGYAEAVANVGPLSFTHNRYNETWSAFCDFFKGYLRNTGRLQEADKENDHGHQHRS